MGKQIDEAVQKLLRMWGTGEMPEVIRQTMLARQSGDRPCDRWSFANQVLMILAGTEDARGFKQWNDVGRRLKKGTKAFYISGPLKKTVRVKNEETDEMEEKTFIYGFKDIPVYRYEDTEGEALQNTRPDYKPKTLPPLMGVAEAWNIPVSYTAGNGRNYGVYRTNADRSHEQIILRTHDASVFFHELSHAAHNRIRPLKNGQVAEQEIVAETCAAVLCLMYGFEGYVSNSRNYVAHYAKSTKEDTTKAVIKLLSDIDQVLQLILSTEEKTATKTA